MEHDIFISYSSKDREIVGAIVSYLEGKKIRCWVSYRDIPGGQNYGSVLVEAVKSCRLVVLVFSSNANQSKEIDKELNIAAKYGKPVLPFKLLDEPYVSAKEYHLADRQWIDAFPEPKRHFDQLVESVATLLEQARKDRLPPEVAVPAQDPEAEHPKEPELPPHSAESVLSPAAPAIQPEPFRHAPKNHWRWGAVVVLLAAVLAILVAALVRVSNRSQVASAVPSVATAVVRPQTGATRPDSTQSHEQKTTNVSRMDSVKQKTQPKPADAEPSGASGKSSIAKSSHAYGMMTDARDGHAYKTVRIGSQVWMAENLNYATSSGSWCYDDKPSNCSRYGRLYDWVTAKSACPEGWHVPKDAEWTKLTDSLDFSTAGTQLKSTSGWNSSGNGTDAYGFRVLPAGYRNGASSFDEILNSTYFWTANSDPNGTRAWYRNFDCGKATLERSRYDKAYGFSLRCVQGP